VLIAQAVFLLEHGQTDRQTDRHTDSPTYAALGYIFGVGRGLIVQRTERVKWTSYRTDGAASQERHQRTTEDAGERSPAKVSRFISVLSARTSARSYKVGTDVADCRAEIRTASGPTAICQLPLSTTTTTTTTTTTGSLHCSSCATRHETNTVHWRRSLYPATAPPDCQGPLL